MQRSKLRLFLSSRVFKAAKVCLVGVVFIWKHYRSDYTVDVVLMFYNIIIMTSYIF